MTLTEQAVERLQEQYSDKLESYFESFTDNSTFIALQEALKKEVVAEFSKDIIILMKNSGATTFNLHHLR